MVRGQFAHKVVNACLRAPLHNPDDADIDPPRPILFVHIASQAVPIGTFFCFLDGATPYVV
jgi:hypothetical protein